MRFIFGVLLAAAVSAQTPPRDAVNTSPLRGTAIVSGMVVDADNQPVRQAFVRLIGDARASRGMVTGSDGRFAFSDVAAGEFSLVASKPGHPDANHGARKAGRPGAKIQLRDGMQMSALTLRMERGAVLAGTVYDDRGQPLPGASVTAFQAFTALDGSTSLRSVVSSGSAFPTTDDRGMFRFFGLPAGEYVVGLSPFFRGLGEAARVPTDDEIREAFARANASISPAAPPKPAAVQRPQMNLAPGFFPDVTNPLDAQRIRVAAGEERTGLDLHAVLRLNGTASGVISGFDGPAQQIEVVLSRPAPAGTGSTLYAIAKPDRTFSLGSLLPGDYTVYARTRTAPFLTASQSFTIGSGDVSGIQLQLAPLPNLDGQLAFDASAPPLSMTGFSVSLYPPTSTSYGPRPNGGTSAADGRFSLSSIPSTRAWIGVSVPPGRSRLEPLWMVSAIKLGERDITDLPIEFQEGQAYPALAVTITDKISSLSGVIQRADGTPATDVFVVAIAADRQYWVWQSRRIKSARPDADGKYIFPGLPAGEYKVAVTTDLESSDLIDRSFLEEIRSVAADVTVAPGEKKIFDLKMGGLSSPARPAARRRQ
jgi:protocatechuate 3,4-dioxygenase beta subunit